MRYIGIDFGDKHIGISVSDENATLAFPYETFSNDGELIFKLKKLATEKNISGFVIGESKDFKGKENPIMIKAKTFAMALKEATSIDVYFEPEFMTSVEARHIQGGGEKTHASAAAIILQSFLDKKKNNL